MKEKYFKVVRGFGTDDFIPITEKELEKAIYAHISGKTVVFDNGSINGAHISAIMPDFHRAMGWNYSYKLQPEDFSEINGLIGGEYKGILGQVKEKVNYLMKSGQAHLIGTGEPFHPSGTFLERLSKPQEVQE